MATTSVRMQQRRDTTANWVSNNPILGEGELGYDETTDQIKIGDGTSHWADLAYINITLTDISTRITALDADPTSAFRVQQDARLLASFAALIKGVTSVSSSAAPTVWTTTKYDATGAARTPTLPALSGLAEGATFGVQKGDTTTNTVTFTCAGSDTFDSGSTTFTFRYADLRYFQVVVIGGSKFWKVVSGNTPQSTIDTQIAAVTAKVTSTTQTGDYTLALADAGTVVEMNKATAVTTTIPPEASVAWPAGTVLEVFQLGAGQVTVAAGAGVTLIAPLGAKTAMQYGSIYLRKRATDSWIVTGDTTT